jgi:hypothetical protein
VDQRTDRFRMTRADDPDPPLLYSRKQSRKKLGDISDSSVKRLEEQGRLTPIRLSRSPTAMVFYAADQVLALARGEAGDER